ncbi:hypothetical protein Bca4012_076189 [Brassica carinata]|uniref:Uncharacterized protein n=1 Tax=Brassica carinata TaxID=52824 RepID=A0A8X7QD19_BRACI|nr:hypothetical protein Bca52824_073429 [Brassica carinata]
MTSSGSSYFSLQTATSSAPITEGGPIKGYRLPPAGEALLATIALGVSALTARSREASEESMDSVGATLNLLDLTLLPMEEESGERPDSDLISGTGRRKDLKISERKEGREKETKGIRRRNRRHRIENPRNTLHASRGKPHVNTNLETNKRGASPFSRQNFGPKYRGRKDPPCYFPSSRNLSLKEAPVPSNRNSLICRVEASTP